MAFSRTMILGRKALLGFTFAAATALSMTAGAGNVLADHNPHFHPYSFDDYDDCGSLVRRNCAGSPASGYYRKPTDTHAYNRMACAEARQRVRGLGYKIIATKDCAGKTYSFTATRKGHHYIVKVNAYTGRLKAHAI
jgi:hypothetical protein